MVREKHKLEVTFDIEEAFDFMRFLMHDQSIEARKGLEQVLDNMKSDANAHFFVGLMAMKYNPAISSGFLAGTVCGLNLALAIARPNEKGSVREFLANHTKRGENVVDIMDAFRKQTKQ